MTTAWVKHRDYVPDDWVAIEFCNVEFFGDNADFFSKKWRDIEYEQYQKLKPKTDDLKERKKLLKKERNSVKAQLNNSKRWWKFWKGKIEKELNGRLSEINQSIEEIKSELTQIENNMFYEAYTLVRKGEKFLSENGFVLKSTNSHGNECVTHTDIWELI